MRKPLLAGNWKMNKTRDEALQFIYTVNKSLPSITKVDAVICAPTILLRCLVKRQGDDLRIGAQNMHYKENGAFTGETSAPMLETTGIEYVIIGHSERRAMFNETDENVNLKIQTALKYNLTPIICCGETLAEREANQIFDVLRNQIQKAYKNIAKEAVSKTVIAYEPIWAIGTGRTATSDVAQEACAFIRKVLAELYDNNTAQMVRILYGGSVTTANISELMSKEDIDGALVGGASLEAQSFLQLVKACV